MAVLDGVGGAAMVDGARGWISRSTGGASDEGAAAGTAEGSRPSIRGLDREDLVQADRGRCLAPLDWHGKLMRSSKERHVQARP